MSKKPPATKKLGTGFVSRDSIQACSDNSDLYTTRSRPFKPLRPDTEACDSRERLRKDLELDIEKRLSGEGLLESEKKLPLAAHIVKVIAKGLVLPLYLICYLFPKYLFFNLIPRVFLFATRPVYKAFDSLRLKILALKARVLRVVSFFRRCKFALNRGLAFFSIKRLFFSVSKIFRALSFVRVVKGWKTYFKEKQRHFRAFLLQIFKRLRERFQDVFFRTPLAKILLVIRRVNTLWLKVKLKGSLVKDRFKSILKAIQSLFSLKAGGVFFKKAFEKSLAFGVFAKSYLQLLKERFFATVQRGPALREKIDKSSEIKDSEFVKKISLRLQEFCLQKKRAFISLFKWDFSHLKTVVAKFSNALTAGRKRIEAWLLVVKKWGLDKSRLFKKPTEKQIESSSDYGFGRSLRLNLTAFKANLINKALSFKEVSLRYFGGVEKIAFACNQMSLRIYYRMQIAKIWTRALYHYGIKLVRESAENIAPFVI